MNDERQVAVRPYEPRDREAVRRICCETADRGGPVEAFFSDRDVFADFVTGYYTAYEAQSLWVAEQGGQVIGYLTGCLDTRRCRRLTACVIVPRASVKALGRGALWSRATWRLAWAGLQTLLRGGGHARPSLERYPAHLHINLLRAFRGRRVGLGLVERFMAQAQAAGVRGVHVAIRGDNPPSRRFFERLGFIELSRHPVVFPNGASYDIRETVVYGKMF